MKRAEPRDKQPGSSNGSSTTSSLSVPCSSGSNLVHGLPAVNNPAIVASCPWWAQVPGATALVTPSGLVPSQAQLNGASLISPAQFSSGMPWSAMTLPAIAGWTPNSGHSSTAPLPGFSVWPSAFNTIGAQAALAQAAAQALGSYG